MDGFDDIDNTDFADGDHVCKPEDVYWVDEQMIAIISVLKYFSWVSSFQLFYMSV